MTMDPSLARRGGVAARERWGPDPHDPAIRLVGLLGWDASVLERIRRVGQGLGVPLQALRADRVLSFAHLLMAFEHHERAVDSRRGGAHDPGVDFLRYAGAHKQIKKAMAALGVPLDGADVERPGVVLVALGRVEGDRFSRALEAHDLVPLPVVFEPQREQGAGSGRPVFCASRQAQEYWDTRLGLKPDVTHDEREARLLGEMALVALDA